MRRTRGRLNIPLLAAAIASSLLIVVVVVGWATERPTSGASVARLGPPPPIVPSNATALPTEIVLAAGSSVLTPAGGYRDYLITTTMSGTLGGAFSTDAPLTAYVINGSAFLGFETGTPLSAWVWTSGAGTFATIDLSLGPGTYYLIFSAPTASSNVDVDVMSSVQVSFPLPTPS